MKNKFGTHLFKINAAFISGAYPQVSKRYGPDQELDLQFSVSHPQVTFAPISGEDIGI